MLLVVATGSWLPWPFRRSAKATLSPKISPSGAIVTPPAVIPPLDDLSVEKDGLVKVKEEGKAEKPTGMKSLYPTSEQLKVLPCAALLYSFCPWTSVMDYVQCK